MEDSAKNWLACGWYCWGQALEAEARYKVASGQRAVEHFRDVHLWRIRAIAALLHHAGEGWSTIRKRMNLEPHEEMFLHRWTT